MDQSSFTEKMNTLARFEVASGAKLNLHKTTVIPVGEGPIPPWLLNYGCAMVSVSDRFRYLGLLAGIHIVEEELIRDLHTKKKMHGGVDWPLMEETANAFLVKNTVKLLQRANEDWVLMAEAIVNDQIRTSSRPTEIKSWKLDELMLGLKALRTPKSPTLNRMMSSWFKELLDSEETWNTRWCQLWKRSTTSRTKLRLWRFLRKGYFTNAKAGDWNLDDGLCKRCDMEKESFIHAIWTCPRILERQKWVSWLLFTDTERQWSQATGEPFMTVIDKALAAHSSNQAPILLILATLRVNWAERNLMQFQGQVTYRGIRVLLNEVEVEITALQEERRLSDDQKQRLDLTSRTTRCWRLETTRWLNGATARNQFQAEEFEPMSADAFPIGRSHAFDETSGWSEVSIILWDTREHRQHRDNSQSENPQKRRTRAAREVTTTQHTDAGWNQENRARLSNSLALWADTCIPRTRDPTDEHDRPPDTDNAHYSAQD
ncbi:hypothetical protein R1sor_018568 [Riccia sorocarpa]|uniref:Reverse transcriptase zinc-binding domain-containing protein n=1 Tax=Riccia sorocarpa TaxID=122646 RepID=A0ABD3IB43_9MARC